MRVYLEHTNLYPFSRILKQTYEAFFSSEVMKTYQKDAERMLLWPYGFYLCLPVMLRQAVKNLKFFAARESRLYIIGLLGFIEARRGLL